MMNLFAGSKWVAIAVVVLAVGLTSYFVIQYIQEGEQDKITIEIQGETNEKRKEIRDAISNSPGGSDSDSLQYFRDRQGD